MGSPVHDGMRIHTLSVSNGEITGVSGAVSLLVPFTVTGSVSARELSGSPLTMTRSGQECQVTSRQTARSRRKAAATRRMSNIPAIRPTFSLGLIDDPVVGGG